MCPNYYEYFISYSVRNWMLKTLNNNSLRNKIFEKKSLRIHISKIKCDKSILAFGLLSEIIVIVWIADIFALMGFPMVIKTIIIVQLNSLVKLLNRCF